MEAALSLLANLVPLVMLVSTRVGIAFLFLPAPLGTGSPVMVRVGLTALVACAISIPHQHLAAGIDMTPLSLLVGCFGEALVGSVIGLTVRVTIATAEIAGTLAGLSMGLGFAQSVDPSTGDEAVPTAQILSGFAVVIFLILQGHHAVISALAGSLRLTPPGDVFSHVSMEGIPYIGSRMLAHGLQIAAPVVASMFIIQLGKGLVAKVAPRVQIFALFFSVVIAAGLIVLVVAAPSIAFAVSGLIARIPGDLTDLLGGR